MKCFQQLSSILSILLLTADSVICSNVLEVTQDNFTSVVIDSGIPTIVDIYASWCGHCKRLSPIWNQLADGYADNKANFQVVKIDGDLNKDISDKYGVTSFPTIKFFDGKGGVEDVTVTRNLESLTIFVFNKIGIPSNIKRRISSAVVSLIDKNFDKIAFDSSKTVIVAFTAQWCGHCKNLKPVFEKVSDIYRYDSDSIILAEVDTTGAGTSEISKLFNITSFPTILVFPDEENITVPIKYPGGRSVENFVEAINAVVGLDRNLDGTLGTAAGRVKKLDDISFQFALASLEDRKDLLKKLEGYVEEYVGGQLTSAKWYKRYAEKISAVGVEYIAKELDRLTTLITSGSASRAKTDEMKKKVNILKTFDVKPETEKEKVLENKKTENKILMDEL